MTFVLTPQARTDIWGIWSYIAEVNIVAVDRVEQAIFDACEHLAQSPLLGHRRPDLTSRPLLFWTLTRYPNYAVVYRPGTQPLQIIAVVHGRRNIAGVLRLRT